jgi:hypothetical protein
MLNQAQNQNNNTRWALLLIIAIAVAILFALPALGELELTYHAEQGRENQALDAAAISNIIQKKGCRKLEIYECPMHSQKKVICKLDARSDLWGGLIIGTRTNPPVIVTGYPAPYSYWMSSVARDGCFEASITP